MSWKICLLLSLLYACVDAKTEKFTCPRACDCSISLTIQKNLYDIRCTTIDNLAKLIQYNPEQATFIRKLDLSGTKLKKLNVEVINKLKRLEVLDVSHNQLTDLPKALKLNQLTDTLISNNNINTISYWFFPKSVRYIDLSNNSIIELPEAVLNLPKLEEISVNGNHLKCSCYNLNVYTTLAKRFVKFDNDQCETVNGEVNSWRNVHLTCNDDHFLADDHFQDKDLTDDGPDFEGSGTSSIVNLDGKEDDSADEDDFNEFISVNSDSTVKPPITTTPTERTTKTTEKNIVKPNGDFYFPDDEMLSNKTTQDPLLAEGSGDEEPVTTDDLIVIHYIDSTSEAYTNSSEEDGDDGSGSGDMIFYPEIDSIFNIHSTSESITQQSVTPELSTSTTTTTPIPTTTTEPSTTSTTSAPIYIPPPIISVTTKEPSEPTTPEKEPITEQPIIVKDKGNLDTELVRSESTDSNTNVNEELGQVVDESPKKQPFGTYIFLAILLAVLICLIGYTMLKRRISRRDRRSQNRRTQDDLANATEMKDIDKTVSLLNEENEKKKSNGLINENTPMMAANEPDTNGVQKSFDDIREPQPAPASVDNNRSLASPSQQTTPTPMPRANQAEKVKITMTELADSIPKTPVLVTRTKSSAGDEIIVTPNLNQRPNLHKP